MSKDTFTIKFTACLGLACLGLAAGLSYAAANEASKPAPTSLILALYAAGAGIAGMVGLASEATAAYLFWQPNARNQAEIEMFHFFKIGKAVNSAGVELDDEEIAFITEDLEDAIRGSHCPSE